MVMPWRRAYASNRKIFRADRGGDGRTSLPGGVMTATSQVGSQDTDVANGGTETTPGPSIDPMTLARLDYGLFLALRRMGTSTERICSALKSQTYALPLSIKRSAQL